jgi:uncharacterized protein (TIGR00255 family)
MSVYSMTGYASLQTSSLPSSDAPASPRLGLELRSVNSRFLDLSFKLSDELRSYESALRDLLMARLKRGKVELRAYVMHEASAAAALAAPPAALLQQLSRAEEQILAWLPQAQALSVADVMRLSQGQAHRPSSDDSADLLSLAEQALTAFMAMREREGARLATMLRERTTQLRELVQTAQPLVPTLVAAQQQRFLERFTDALKQADAASGAGGQLSATAAQERALTEAAAFAIRIDVAEELTRLNAHLDEIDDLLAGTSRASAKNKKAAAPTEIGKRLDFIIQELHREANTLGSKSSTLELSRISVDMKVLIEQMREQVQNIE